MCVLIQAMVWLGMPLPAAWKLALYFGCIGMFGIGVGMLYTPILVDRLQLEFPSGHAVANILRALTDERLLRRSIGKLGGGTGAGIAIAALVSRVAWLERIGISASTVGAGLIVGSRIGVPALVMGLVGELLVPHLRAAGYLGPHDPFRKIGFLVGLAMIMGAAVVDLVVIGREAVRRVRARRGERAAGASRAGSAAGGSSPGSSSGARRWCWWRRCCSASRSATCCSPLALVFLFVFVNGISTGISDWNPISSAFVVSVLLMSALGLRSPIVAMMAASILLVSTTVGVDMQQDRSTGWRLGSNRAIQFRYQAVGIMVGAVLCVAMASLFMNAYPVLRVDTFTHPEAHVGDWQSAMTFKFVGAIRGHGAPGAVPGDRARARLRASASDRGRCASCSSAGGAYRRFVGSGAIGFAVGWIVDAVVLSSPYASSTGGFLELSTAAWFAGGSVLAAFLSPRRAPRRPRPRRRGTRCRRT